MNKENADNVLANESYIRGARIFSLIYGFAVCGISAYYLLTQEPVEDVWGWFQQIGFILGIVFGFVAVTFFSFDLRGQIGKAFEKHTLSPMHIHASIAMLSLSFMLFLVAAATVIMLMQNSTLLTVYFGIDTAMTFMILGRFWRANKTVLEEVQTLIDQGKNNE